MFFTKIALVSLVGGFAALVAACSDEPKPEAAKAKQSAEAACQHINELCASTEGFKTQDCSTSNASYEKLSAAEKAQADSITPCVIASTSCQSAINCLRPAAEESSTAKNEKPPRANDTEDACEHINGVCADEPGFKKQNCASSNDEYEKLNASDKELADEITVCIMKTKSCKSAFECLDFN